jgi:hypothetical protein
MVSPKEYDRVTEAEWKKRKVRTLVVLINSQIQIPKGTICSIIRKAGGFTLHASECPHCGVSVYISKVSPRDVTVVEAQP